MCVFISELPLAASSNIPVDLHSELTHSLTKLSIDQSSHTDHGSTSDKVNEVSESIITQVTGNHIEDICTYVSTKQMLKVSWEQA